jgi:hypothetical protein
MGAAILLTVSIGIGLYGYFVVRALSKAYRQESEGF